MSALIGCPDCSGEGFFLVRNHASIHYVSSPDSLYDAMECLTCGGTGEVEVFEDALDDRGDVFHDRNVPPTAA